MHHDPSYIAPRMTLRTTAFALAVLALVPATTGARTADQRALWATVNVCDTLRHPNVIGVRGSMPGADDHRETLWMRFRVQFYAAASDRWKFVRQNGDSGFVKVGPAKYRARQAGQLFTIPPPPGGSFKLRGRVTFKWKLHKKVVRTETRVTTAGHHSSSGADPDGYSSDTCVIS
jgi:hypothetical protein